MPVFKVTALEKFLVKTVYEHVEAETAEQAAEQCRAGNEAYDSHTVEEGDDSWVETVSVEKVG